MRQLTFSDTIKSSLTCCHLLVGSDRKCRRSFIEMWGVSLFTQRGANLGDATGGTELDAPADDKFGVFLDEDFAGRTEIEFGGFVAEEFAVDAGPDEAAVGVDIHFGDAEFGGGQVFIFVHADSGRINRAASRIDASHFVGGHARAAVHDDGRWRQTSGGDFIADAFDDVEMERLVAFEFVSAVAGADGGGERIATGALDEFDDFIGVGQAGVAFIDDDIFLDAAEFTEFGFNAQTFGMGAIDDAFGDGDIFLKRLVRGIDHDGAVKARVDAIVASRLVAVVKMDGINGVGEDFLGGANDGFDHPFIGVIPRALGELDDEGCLGFDAALEEAHGLLGVIDVIGADGVFPVGKFEKLSSGNDHDFFCSRPSRKWASGNSLYYELSALFDALMENVIIVGTGCAGLTAAIYTARANLSPLVLEGKEPGGQLTTTTMVENFPGFPEGIDGPQLIMNMKAQAAKFGARFAYSLVTEFEPGDGHGKPHRVKIDDDWAETKTLIIASGASAKWLGLPGESKLVGHGLTSCATCDGAFYRNVPVAVVGGGDSACEEALFLTRFASKVYLVHRRDTLRASKIMADRALAHEKIEPVWNSLPLEYLSDAAGEMRALKIRDTATNTDRELEVACVFVAIGHTPNTQPFVGKLPTDDAGYLLQTRGTATSLPGVFAAGDVADTIYRQAITAAGQGCAAAIEVEKFLADQE